MLARIRHLISCSRRQGIVLIITLAVVALATVLVIALLTTATQSRGVLKSNLNGVVADLMVDNAVEYVKAQLASATTQKTENGLPRLWVSQPGAITTYAEDGSPDTVVKLYSSQVPQLRGNAILSPDEIAALDVPTNWANLPDHFVDLNAPKVDFRGTSYPILDPRLLSAPGANGAEGYTTIPPSLPSTLPMPVRWLYMLEDGTLGTLNSANKFIPLYTADTSKTHSPIIARIAYWVDDETCKVNINTAAEASYWDYPVADTAQERYLATQQPTSQQFPRMPGHPAGVCLSSIFYPGYRFYPDGFYDPANSKALANEQISELWQLGRLLPLPGTAGQGSTDWPSIWNVEPVTTPRHHRYATPYEAVFTSTGHTTMPRSTNPHFSRQDQIERLARVGGLITTQSSGPELTLYGTPRVNTWPVHAQTLPNIIAANTNSASTPSPNNKDTAYNRKAAYASLISNVPYFIQRSEPGNGGADLESNVSGDNNLLLNYLNQLTSLPPPGHSFPNIELNTFAQKYGPDAPTITLGALDYIRSINLADGHLESNTQFSILCPGTGNESHGFGQVSPLQPRLTGNEYQTSRQTQSLGRICTLSEVALLINCRAEVVKVNGSLVVAGDPSSKGRSALRKGKEGDREIEVSLLLETFLPGHSFADYRPYLTALLTGGNPGEIKPYVNSVSIAEFPTLYLNDKLLKIDINRLKLVSSNRFHNGWQGFGGNLGLLSLSNGTIGFEPVVITGNGSATSFAPLHFRGGSEQSKEFKLVLYDSAASTAIYDTHQIIPLKFPDILPSSGIQIPRLPADNAVMPSLTSRISATLSNANQPLLHSSDVLQSLIPMHGDYRLTATQRWQERTINDMRALLFSPHPSWGKLSQAHHLTDKVLIPSSIQPPPQGPLPDLTYSQPTDLPPALSNPSAMHLLWHGEAWKTLSGSSLLDLLRSDTPNRGPVTPDTTGDYDNGLASYPDGPYCNRQDDGHWAAALENEQIPYFSNVSQIEATIPPVSPHTFNAQRSTPSPGVFGSLPTGTASYVPWHTLLFRPQPEHYGAKEIPDHLFLDLFYTPVLEPEPLSLNCETQGKINLNQDLLPFTKIQRKTALHALLKGEALIAIPNTDSETYKTGTNDGAKYRRFIDPYATLQLWRQKLVKQRGLCRTSSQVCELPLVPEGLFLAGEIPNLTKMEEYWRENRLTGDNSRERPYTRLYPRLTTQSNTYRIHLLVQVLTPRRSEASGTIKNVSESIQAERSGSVTLHRRLRLQPLPNQVSTWKPVPDYRKELPSKTTPPLTDYYVWGRSPLQH